MNTIGNIVKEKLQNYEEKLKASNRRSLSRICNCTEGAFSTKTSLQMDFFTTICRPEPELSLM